MKRKEKSYKRRETKERKAEKKYELSRRRRRKTEGSKE
jgi:hypothetical protein